MFLNHLDQTYACGDRVFFRLEPPAASKADASSEYAANEEVGGGLTGFNIMIAKKYILDFGWAFSSVGSHMWARHWTRFSIEAF